MVTTSETDSRYLTKAQADSLTTRYNNATSDFERRQISKLLNSTYSTGVGQPKSKQVATKLQDLNADLRNQREHAKSGGRSGTRRAGENVTIVRGAKPRLGINDISITRNGQASNVDYNEGREFKSREIGNVFKRQTTLKRYKKLVNQERLRGSRTGLVSIKKYDGTITYSKSASQALMSTPSNFTKTRNPTIVSKDKTTGLTIYDAGGGVRVHTGRYAGDVSKELKAFNDKKRDYLSKGVGGGKKPSRIFKDIEKNYMGGGGFKPLSESSGYHIENRKVVNVNPTSTREAVKSVMPKIIGVDILNRLNSKVNLKFIPENYINVASVPLGYAKDVSAFAIKPHEFFAGHISAYVAPKIKNTRFGAWTTEKLGLTKPIKQAEKNPVYYTISDRTGLKVPVSKDYSGGGQVFMDENYPTGQVTTRADKIIKNIDLGVAGFPMVNPRSSAIDPYLRESASRDYSKAELMGWRNELGTNLAIAGLTYGAVQVGTGVSGMAKHAFNIKAGGATHLMTQAPKLSPTTIRNTLKVGKAGVFLAKAGMVTLGAYSYGSGLRNAPSNKEAVKFGGKFASRIEAGLFGSYAGSRWGNKAIRRYNFKQSAVTEGLSDYSKNMLKSPVDINEYKYRFGKDTLTAYDRASEYKQLYGSKFSKADAKTYNTIIGNYKNFKPTDPSGTLKVHASKYVEYGLRNRYGWDFNSKPLNLKQAFPALSRRQAINTEKFMRGRDMGGSASRYFRFTKTKPTKTPHDIDFMTKWYETKGMAKTKFIRASGNKIPADTHYQSEMRGHIFGETWRSYSIKSGGSYKAPSDYEMFGRNWEGMTQTQHTPNVLTRASGLPQTPNSVVLSGSSGGGKPFAFTPVKSGSYKAPSNNVIKSYSSTSPKQLSFSGVSSNLKSPSRMVNAFSRAGSSGGSSFASNSLSLSGINSLSNSQSPYKSPYKSSYKSPPSTSKYYSDYTSIVNSTSISNSPSNSFSNSNSGSPSNSNYARYTNYNYIVPPPFSLGGGFGGSKPKKRGKRQFKYTPSLFAIGEGVTGVKPKILTGLGIRPIM